MPGTNLSAATPSQSSVKLGEMAFLSRQNSPDNAQAASRTLAKHRLVEIGYDLPDTQLALDAEGANMESSMRDACESKITPLRIPCGVGRKIPAQECRSQ